MPTSDEMRQTWDRRPAGHGCGVHRLRGASAATREVNVIGRDRDAVVRQREITALLSDIRHSSDRRRPIRKKRHGRLRRIKAMDIVCRDRGIAPSASRAFYAAVLDMSPASRLKANAPSAKPKSRNAMSRY